MYILLGDPNNIVLVYMVLNGKGSSNCMNILFVFHFVCFCTMVEQWWTTQSFIDCTHVDHKQLDDPLPFKFTY